MDIILDAGCDLIARHLVGARHEVSESIYHHKVYT